MSGIHGIFGIFIFGKIGGKWKSYYEVTRTHTGRYSEHAVHLQKERSEWCGNSLIKLDIKMVLNSAWCGDPRPIVSQLLFYKENALAVPLILGGKPQAPGLSLFTLREINETTTHWLHSGQPIRIELDLSFMEYAPFLQGFTIPGFGGLS
jgi:phage protein U